MMFLEIFIWNFQTDYGFEIVTKWHYLFTLFGGLKIRIFLAAILDLCTLQELSKVDILSFRSDWFYDTRKGQRNKELHSTKHFEVKVKAF